MKTVMNHSFALGICLLALAGCAPAAGSHEDDAESDEQALTNADPGTTALLKAVRDSEMRVALLCKTAPGVSPRFELRAHSLYYTGTAKIVIREFSGPHGAAREFARTGTLEGIPRDG